MTYGRFLLPAFALACVGMIAVPASAREVVTREGGRTYVDAPTTKVETGGDRGTKVKVRAPFTGVNVDTDRRHVRIRVPFYSGDIRW